ncbi:hypothetical protein [Paenibacillus aestuarii]|uniref:YmiA family membrane protein n=1 Tax=Paenibacillus aestuarii TaxID=516965 RepID=A0ABW0KES5_9BACL|nr:hypothetical protein [Paenibacillus aestuarii]
MEHDPKMEQDSVSHEERTDQQPKLAVVKGCLWGVVCSLLLWALLIWLWIK